MPDQKKTPLRSLRLFRSKKLSPEHVAVMNKAIRRNAKGGMHDVHIKYTKADGTQVERKIRPLAVKGKHLLLAHDHDRGEIRSFRMDRVQMSKHASITALLYPYITHAEPYIELTKIMATHRAKDILKSRSLGRKILRALTRIKRRTVTSPPAKAILRKPEGRLAVEVLSDALQYKTPSIQKYQQVYETAQRNLAKKGLKKSAEEVVGMGFWDGFEKRALSIPRPLKLRLAEGIIGAGIGGAAGAGVSKYKKDGHMGRDALIGAGIGGLSAVGASKLIRSVRGIKAEDIPDVYYHGHRAGLRDAIKTEGLRTGKPSSFRSSVRGKDYPEHIFLTKDKSYAKAYGKTNAKGFVDYAQQPQIVSAVLPKESRRNIANVMSVDGVPDIGHYGSGADLAGVGRYSVDGFLIGIGSEYAHKGSISPKNLVFSEKEKDALIAKITSQSKNERLGNKLFGIG